MSRTPGLELNWTTAMATYERTPAKLAVDCRISEAGLTVNAYRDAIIRQIRELLQGKLCVDDRRILVSMLRMAVETVTCRHEDDVLSNLRQLVTMQFQLQTETRCCLASNIQPLAARWTTDHATTDHDACKMIVGIALAKIFVQLKLLPIGDTQASTIRNWFDLENQAFTARKAVQARRAEKLRLMLEKKRLSELVGISETLQLSNKRISNLGKISEYSALSLGDSARALQHANDQLLGDIQLEEAVGMNLRDPNFGSRLANLTTTFEEAFGNHVSTALFIPICHKGKLSNYRKILNSNFLLPRQLFEKIDLLQEQTKCAAAFDVIRGRVERYEESLLAFGNAEMTVCHVVDNPHELIELHEEVERCLKSDSSKPQRQKRLAHYLALNNNHLGGRTENHITASSLSNLHADPDSCTGSDSCTDSDGCTESDSCTDSDGCTESDRCTELGSCSDLFQGRTIIISGYSLRTWLEQDVLSQLVEDKMDVGTFRNVWQSIAYHVQKHAPNMLVEEYIAKAQSLWASNAAMELRARTRNKYSANGMNEPEGENSWVKVLRGKEGCGCYSWWGRILWFDPNSA